MIGTLTIQTSVLHAVMLRAEADLHKALRERDQLLAECAASHMSPPADYWHAAHQAAQRVTATAAVVETILAEAEGA